MMSKKTVLTTMQELCARSGYAHTVLLTSFRRNGQAVETPVHVSIRIQGHLEPLMAGVAGDRRRNPG
jgi:hypothetical protein